MMDWPVVVSYYTPDYATHARQLVESCDYFGLPHDVERVASRGTWAQDCARKPAHLRAALERHGWVAWLDADARVVAEPIELRDRGPMLSAHWRDGVELLSGTLVLRSSPEIAELLERWEMGCAAEPTAWDQRVLQRVVHAVSGLVVRVLPPSYAWIREFMFMLGQPVIEHLQASRQTRVRRAEVR